MGEFEVFMNAINIFFCFGVKVVAVILYIV